MGRVKSKGILGMSGSLGELIFYEVNGKQYVRSKPGEVRDAKSPAQLAQRQRMQVSQGFLRNFRPFLATTFPAEEGKRPGFYAANSYNLRFGLKGTYPNIGINKQKALLCKGSLATPVNPCFEREGEFLRISWEWDATEVERGSDQLFAVVFQASSQEMDFQFTGFRREETSCLWKPKLNLDAGKLEMWLAFRDWQGKEMSDSVYVV